MTPLRVLLPLALLVAVTLAEYPSSSQIRLYGKEDSSEDGILLPNNPGIETDDVNSGQPNDSNNAKPVGDKEDKKNEPIIDESKSDGKKVPADSGKSDDEKKLPDNTGIKKDDIVSGKPKDSDNTVIKKDDIVSGKPKDSDNVKPVGDKEAKKNEPIIDESKSNGKKDPADNGKSDDGKKSPNNPVAPTNPKDENKKSDKSEEPKKPDYRLSEDIEPLHYTIELTVNQHDLPKNDYRYIGKVSIDISVKKVTKVIKLHYDRRTIEKLKPTLVEATTAETIKVTETEEKDLDVSICELTATKDLEAGKLYTLTLEYEGKVSDNSRGFYKGSYFNEENEKRWYAVTHFEPLGARSAFPCFDEPALKAEFTISIKHSTGYTAISNMPVDKTEDIDKDWKKVTFQKTPKMSTYLVAFAITDFEATGKKSNLVYSRKDVAEMAEYAASVGEEVLKELRDYTDIKFSLPKMDQIALPLLRPGAMENWGLVTYRESALLYDEKVNATIDRQKVASIIAHEFAHQWFGNLVSPKWWSYIWLNEGFATYFQYYIADKIDPSWHFMDQFNVAALQGRAFVYDADWEKTRPMDKEESSEAEIGDMFDDIAYQKAAAVIRMFVHVLGEEKFQKGIKNYLKEHKEGVATSADLFKALDGVADKDSLPEGASVSTIFGDWATKKGYPVLTVTRNKKTGAVTVAQEPFYLEEPKESAKATWYIPLNYVQENDEHDFDDTTVQDWLTTDSKKISQKIDKTGWIIFNKQQTGYYRVNYDDENWIAIARYLSGVNFTTIHSLNRAQLIDDALNLALTGRLKYDTALSLLEYLEQETDYIVWKSAFAALGSLKKLLAPTEYYSEFSKYLLTVTEALMKNVTYASEDGEPYLRKLLRVDAIKWACDSGSELCKLYATEEVNKWLSDPYNNATLPRDLEKVCICGALRNATFEEWKRVFVKYVGSTNTEEKAMILSALGCSSEEDTLNYLLDLTIQPDSIFAGRILDVFQTVYSNSALGVQVTLDFILQNIHKLLTYDVKFYDNLEKYVNDLGSRVVLEDDANKLQEIVAKKVIPLEKTQSAVDAAQRNVKWLKANGKEINTWFGSYNTVTELPPVTTTKKGNSAGSLSFSALLLAAPLVLARLR